MVVTKFKALGLNRLLLPFYLLILAAECGLASTSFVDGLPGFIPEDSAVDSAGFTYIVGTSGSQGRIIKIDQTGGLVYNKAIAGVKPVSIHVGVELPAAVGVLVGPSDAIYVASETKVVLLDLEGTTKATYSAPGNWVIRDVVYSPLVSSIGTVEGAVYISGKNGGDAMLARIAPTLSGAATHSKTFGNNASGDTAYSVTVDDIGDVYVAGRLAAGSNQLGELGYSSNWTRKIYERSGGATIDSLGDANNAINSGTLLETSTHTSINFGDLGNYNDIAAVATATFFVPTEGSYTFTGTSDDGQELRVDGVAIISDDSLHGEEDRTATIKLSPGIHTIRFLVFERGGSEVMRLKVQGPGDMDASTFSSFDPGGNKSYVLKFDPNLSGVLAQYFTSPDLDQRGHYFDLEHSRGWIYATGYWEGTAEVDGDDPADGRDTEIVKLDTALRLRGRATVKGASNVRGHNVAADNSGNVYVVGAYGPGSVEFNGDGIPDQFSIASAKQARYFAKLNANMDFDWVVTEVGVAPDFNNSIDAQITWNDTLQKVFVTGSFTGLGSLTLGDPGGEVELSGGQGFLAVLEPDGLYTERVDLTVVSEFGQSGTQVLPFGGPPELPVTQARIKGSEITVSVPEEGIYHDINDVELENPSEETIRTVAQIRFRPTDYTLSDGTITDDGQASYTFVLERDITIEFHWAKEYALTMDTDLTGTVGTDIGELKSEASGRPEPDIKKHWIRENEVVNAKIDGVVEELDSLGGTVRYVVSGYEAVGPPNTNTLSGNFSTVDFFPFRTIEARQQIRAFTMDGPARINYKWRKQNGIRVNTTGPASSAFPLIFVVEDPEERERLGLPPQRNATGTGTFYYDEHTHLKIATIKVRGTDQLRGWFGGDGVIFGQDGVLADLDSEFDFETNPYIGKEVLDLIQPARVMWDYGDRIFEETIRIGGFVTFDTVDADVLSTIRTDLEPTDVEVIDGPEGSGVQDMGIWDANGRKYYGLRPGELLTFWRTNDPTNPDARVIMRLFILYPVEPHYRHVAQTPGVALDPDPNDLMTFKGVQYAENDAAVNDSNEFLATQPGKSVLLFGQLNDVGRDGQDETLRVRVVETKLWDDNLPPVRDWPIGQKITSGFDSAELDTGFVFFELARYNPFIYNRDGVEGPVIPVNRQFESGNDHELVVVWYERRDELLWPYQAEMYEPQWPTKAQGLSRIVIASEFGSECVADDGLDQPVVGSVVVDLVDNDGNVIGTETLPPATTYDPARFEQVQIYNQPAPELAGRNPNEEHALIAPSKRFAAVSPLPNAAFALRDKDLNVTTEDAFYTSDPYVLVQYLDTADNEFKMRVYDIVRKDTNLSLGALSYDYDFEKEMLAGKPVIPFYPLGVVIGASPCLETFGIDGNPNQLTYWEDHKGGSWAVSGGDGAYFEGYFYYPMTPNFWWPDTSLAGTSPVIEPKSIGDCIPFLPNHAATGKTTFLTKPTSIKRDNNNVPQVIDYMVEWPKNLPILKVGETLTYAGGEFAADNPTRPIPTDDGGVQEVDTPGLPGVLGWAAGEMVYDDLNPAGDDQAAFDNYSARIYQPLSTRQVDLPVSALPETFQPANPTIIRVKDGEWIFVELSSSLQKRVFYDPIFGRLGIRGLLNDKTVGDPDLTSFPPPINLVEPNVMTPSEFKELRDLSTDTDWVGAVRALYKLSRNPNLLDKDGDGGTDDTYFPGLGKADNAYRVGLEQKIVRDDNGDPVIDTSDLGILSVRRDDTKASPLQGLGPGLALTANPRFLNPTGKLPNGDLFPDISYVTIAENNHTSLGSAPVSLFVIQIRRDQRFRGAIKTILSDNVFDENITLRHQGDFGANAEQLVFEWWYRVEDGRTFPPPDRLSPGSPNPWKVFTNPNPIDGSEPGRGFYNMTLKGSPNQPEILLSDTLWYVRYRHRNEDPGSGPTDALDWSGVDSFQWAGSANSTPRDLDNDGEPNYQPQLAQGWVKRVLDAVNPYEARIRDFEGDAPSTRVDIISQLGPPAVGPVALNPDKNVIENVGLIELYQTILDRATGLTIGNDIPATSGIANAIQLASTRLLQFYTLLGNEAYSDAMDPTIGYGSDSFEMRTFMSPGDLPPSVFAFQNQVANLMEEELALLRGQDSGPLSFKGRPVFNRLFWNFTKGEGESAYALNYDLHDVDGNGFIDESDALLLYPQGHGDAWGHYVTALGMQYDLLKESLFNWTSRSELYNLLDVVIGVDFLDERKFAQTAAAKAKAGAEIVNLTYRSKYVENPEGQWQGYTDTEEDRSWGVEGWSRRVGQGCYFDWVTANALLPSVHPNEELEGIARVDRTTNKDLAVVSAQLNRVQQVFDEANIGFNPLGLSGNIVPFDINPTQLDKLSDGSSHFEQIWNRAVGAAENAQALFEHAADFRDLLRKIGNSEQAFDRKVFEQDLSYRNRLIEFFGTPYEGTIGAGKAYPEGYEGPDTALWMYLKVREITQNTVPGPTVDFGGAIVRNASGNLEFSNPAGDVDVQGSWAEAINGDKGRFIDGRGLVSEISENFRERHSPTFDGPNMSDFRSDFEGNANVNYTGDDDLRVDLQNLNFPIMARGFTFQAPDEWGMRRSPGKLQLHISKMLQKEADLAASIAAWDGFSGEILRTIYMINAKYDLDFDVRTALIAQTVVDQTLNATILTFNLLAAANEIIGEAFGDGAIDISQGIPTDTPTAGFSVSVGDTLAPLRAALRITGSFSEAGFKATKIGFEKAAEITEFAKEIADAIVALDIDGKERDFEMRQALTDLENLVGDEGIMRVKIFREQEALRQLSDEFRSMVEQAQRLLDEREAYNKRVAALVQRNRYQDMSFRVAHNSALENYRDAYDLAARYAYMAGKAYDYETNLDSSHAASAQGILTQIVRKRVLGEFDGGEPQLAGGLSECLARLKINYDVLEGQLGFNNPQKETDRFSLRHELFRQPVGPLTDEMWRQELKSPDHLVPDLWQLPEFRRYCRPFAAFDDGPQPGLVIEFSSFIEAGKNFFGKDLAGGDHFYDPSNFATKVRSIGVWFQGYDSLELAETPRVYLIPVGTDVMSIPDSDDLRVRKWDVLDQKIPIPLPVITADLNDATWRPLSDSLLETMGEPRRFSSFRAHHYTDNFDENEMTWDSRLVGRSVRNTRWMLIIPGQALHSDAAEGLTTFIDGPVDPATGQRDSSRSVNDIKLFFQTYGYSGN